MRIVESNARQLFNLSNQRRRILRRSKRGHEGLVGLLRSENIIFTSLFRSYFTTDAGNLAQQRIFRNLRQCFVLTLFKATDKAMSQDKNKSLILITDGFFLYFKNLCGVLFSSLETPIPFFQIFQNWSLLRQNHVSRILFYFVFSIISFYLH
jgi:hypothetical protein